MTEVKRLHGAEPRKILQTLINEQVPALMSYKSKKKWHTAKVLVTDLGAELFSITISPRKEPLPMDIRIGDKVGISSKFGYGKFVFETNLIDLEPAEPTEENCGGGG